MSFDICKILTYRNTELNVYSVKNINYPDIIRLSGTSKKIYSRGHNLLSKKPNAIYVLLLLLWVLQSASVLEPNPLPVVS